MVDVEDRRTFIGGSDAPVILGVSGWKGPYELWQEKVGLKEPEDISDIERVHFGIVLEDVVAREFASRTGKSVRRVNQRQVSKDYPFAVAQIDRRIVGGGILECKTADAFRARDWGEEDDSQIPIPYWTQVQHQMMVTGEKDAYVAVLIGGNTFRTYYVKRDEDFIENLVLAERVFYSHMVTKTRPEPISFKEAKEVWKNAPALPVEGTEEHILLAREYHEIKKMIDPLEKRLEEIQGILAAVLEENGDTLIVQGETVATWKEQSRTSIDTKLLKADLPEIAEKYLKVSSFRKMTIKKI